MSMPWNFAPNVLLDFYYAAGFSAPPGPPQTYGGIQCQHMRPSFNATAFNLIFMHRVIVPVVSVPIPRSSDIVAGIAVSMSDTNPNISQWYSVNDVSIMPYQDAGGNDLIDHYMLLLRRASY